MDSMAAGAASVRKVTDDQPVGDGWGGGGVMDDDYWDDQM